jgi:hypothetical protein
MARRRLILSSQERRSLRLKRELAEAIQAMERITGEKFAVDPAAQAHPDGLRALEPLDSSGVTADLARDPQRPETE